MDSRQPPKTAGPLVRLWLSPAEIERLIVWHMGRPAPPPRRLEVLRQALRLSRGRPEPKAEEVASIAEYQRVYGWPA